jgi:hypothetical protein
MRKVTVSKCPECGSVLRVDSDGHTGFSFHCVSINCKAYFIEYGSTRNSAADNFVSRCERYGYTASLAAKIQAAADQIKG